MNPETTWNRPHLIGIEDLSPEEILTILDTAKSFRRPLAGATKSSRPCVERPSSIFLTNLARGLEWPSKWPPGI